MRCIGIALFFFFFFFLSGVAHSDLENKSIKTEMYLHSLFCLINSDIPAKLQPAMIPGLGEIIFLCRNF